MDFFGELGWILILTVVGVFLLTPGIKKFAEIIGAVDEPGNRKVHTRMMPRMGGVAIYLGFTAMMFVFAQPLGMTEIGLLLGCAIIVIAGILDDVFNLSPKIKLGAQVLAASVLVYFGITVNFITHPFGDVVFLGIFAVPVTILWIIGITNALNLIDGLDGLASGTALIAAVTMAVVALIEGHFLVAGFALILAAAVLGFLPYNFFPAKIFLGDSGSMFLGFTLGALAVQGMTKGAAFISIFIPIIILGIPIFDTLLAVIRRYRNHRPIFEADKEHLHHRLLDVGLSHKQTVLAIYGVNALLGVSAVTLNILSTEQSIVALIVLATAGIFAANKIGVFEGIFRKAPSPKYKRTSVNNYKSTKDYFKG